MGVKISADTVKRDIMVAFVLSIVLLGRSFMVALSLRVMK